MTSSSLATPMTTTEWPIQLLTQLLIIKKIQKCTWDIDCKSKGRHRDCLCIGQRVLCCASGCVFRVTVKLCLILHGSLTIPSYKFWVQSYCVFITGNNTQDFTIVFIFGCWHDYIVACYAIHLYANNAVCVCIYIYIYNNNKLIGV